MSLSPGDTAPHIECTCFSSRAYKSRWDLHSQYCLQHHDEVAGRADRNAQEHRAVTGDDYLGSRFHHGAPFRRAVEEGLIDPKRVVQIGIRGSLNAADMWQFSYDNGTKLR